MFEIVVDDYIVGDVVEFEAHELTSCHRGVQIEILYIYRHESCVECGDDAVEEKFDGEEVDRGCAAVSWIVHAVAAHGEPAAVRVRFFWSVVDNDEAVGDIASAIDWDLPFWNEQNCVSAFGKPRHALGKAAKFFSV